MLKKRLVGVVTVRDGWAIQSFGYRRYLPLGRPEILVQNLDRWGADEILVQCIDRTRAGLAPDLALLDRISRLGLSTPLIYSGGVATIDQGLAVIARGADRLCLDAALLGAGITAGLAELLGAQAVIAALPVSSTAEGMEWLDYRSGKTGSFTAELLELLRSGLISEVLLVDWQHEGMSDCFDMRLLEQFPVPSVPLITFGGLSEARQMKACLEHEQVAAIAVGNVLNYREHSVQHYKRQLAGLPIRPPCYQSAALGAP